MNNGIFTYQLIHATLRSSTPIIWATIAAVICKQANIMNIGLEGIMLFGAFTGITVSYATGSWALGLLGAVIVGIIVSAIIGAAHLKYDAPILVVGFSINLFALGLTRFLLQQIYGQVGAYTPSNPISLPVITISAFKDSPVLSSLFSDYSILEPLAIIMVLALWFVLYKTTRGLRLRSVGLNEMAARTAGINVVRTKYTAIVLSGVFAGIAGAHLSMGYSTMFVENMTNGRGFMALAAMNFGGGNPISALIGCLVFGFSDSLGARLQSTGFPSQFILMIPYVVTVVVLTFAMVSQVQKNSTKKIIKEVIESDRQ